MRITQRAQKSNGSYLWCIFYFAMEMVAFVANFECSKLIVNEETIWISWFWNDNAVCGPITVDNYYFICICISDTSWSWTQVQFILIGWRMSSLQMCGKTAAHVLFNQAHHLNPFSLQSGVDQFFCAFESPWYTCQTSNQLDCVNGRREKMCDHDIVCISKLCRQYKSKPDDKSYPIFKCIHIDVQ